MAQILFNSTPVRVLIDSVQNNLFTEIGELSGDAILSLPIDELTQRLAEKYKVEVPVLNVANIDTTFQDALVPNRQRPNPLYGSYESVPGRVHTLHVPYSGGEHMFHCQPVIPPQNSVTADTSRTEVSIHASGAWLNAETINQKFDTDLQTLEECLKRLRSDLAPFNAQLPQIIRPRLDNRRLAAERTRQTTAGMKYPLRQVNKPPQTYKLPEKPKQLIPNPVKAPAKATEFVLSEADYQDILRICESMSLVMERSPTVFESAEEEHIRVHYLVQLNGQYNGAATGETFNNKGKTDILIRHENTNVFVAECKFWGGYKGLLETVDQLLSYTTWRDTKTALIIFSRNQDFTNVVNEALRAMKDHPHYKSGPNKEGETRFRYVFTHPNDVQRDIIVTLMLFDMPKAAKTS
jgi:hypothetical protein